MAKSVVITGESVAVKRATTVAATFVLAPGVVVKRQRLLRLTPAEAKPRPGEHWDCKCLDCGKVTAKKKHHNNMV